MNVGHELKARGVSTAQTLFDPSRSFIGILLILALGSAIVVARWPVAAGGSPGIAGVLLVWSVWPTWLRYDIDYYGSDRPHDRGALRPATAGAGRPRHVGRLPDFAGGRPRHAAPDTRARTAGRRMALDVAVDRLPDPGPGRRCFAARRPWTGCRTVSCSPASSWSPPWRTYGRLMTPGSRTASRRCSNGASGCSSCSASPASSAMGRVADSWCRSTAHRVRSRSCCFR